MLGQHSTCAHRLGTFIYLRLLKYIQVCAKETPEPRTRISAATVRKMSRAFSIHLRRELIDEIHAVIPDIVAVLNIISQIRKQTLSIEDFTREHQRQVASGTVETKDSTFLLNVRA